MPAKVWKLRGSCSAPSMLGPTAIERPLLVGRVNAGPADSEQPLQSEAKPSASRDRNRFIGTSSPIALLRPARPLDQEDPGPKCNRTSLPAGCDATDARDLLLGKGPSSQAPAQAARRLRGLRSFAITADFG